MRTLGEIVDAVLSESEVDYIGLFEIAFDAREELGARTTDEARQLSLEVVKRLYEKGLRPGDYWGGDFDYWPDDDGQAMLDRIEREWIQANADPHPGRPICWFAARRA